MKKPALIKWRNRDVDTVIRTDKMKNIEFLRNKTSFRKFVSDYRRELAGEVFRLCDDKLTIALLFCERDRLYPQLLRIDLFPLVDQTQLFNGQDRTPEKLLRFIASSIFHLFPDFFQFSIRMPQENSLNQALQQTQSRLKAGDYYFDYCSSYPVPARMEHYLRADLDPAHYAFVPFNRSLIAVIIRQKKISEIILLKEGDLPEPSDLRDQLLVEGYLTPDCRLADGLAPCTVISPLDASGGDLAAEATRQITQYLAGKRQQFDLPVNDPHGSLFQRQVWSEIAKIPYGSVITYQELAFRLFADQKRARNYARAVGAACGANPLPIIIPCHRVIGRDRTLVGFGGGVELKGDLLDLEWMNRVKDGADLVSETRLDEN